MLMFYLKKKEEYANKKANSAENRVTVAHTYILKIKELERLVAEQEYGLAELARIAEENLNKLNVNIKYSST